MITSTYQAQHAAQVRTASGLDVLAGLWLVIAPFALNYSANGGSTTNDVVVGIAVVLLAGIQMLGDNYRVSAPSWINAALGAWLIAAPFLLSIPSGSAAMWNDIVVGAVVLVSAVAGALLVPASNEEA